MNAILLKIFATALALSQVTTQPGAVKTEFDPVRDKDEVVQILVGSRDDPDFRVQGLMPPHALKGPFLEHPQERCLDRQMQAAHFIEHERPTARVQMPPAVGSLPR